MEKQEREREGCWEVVRLQVKTLVRRETEV